MPSYFTTPLFSIQEAVDSSSSIPNVTAMESAGSSPFPVKAASNPVAVDQTSNFSEDQFGKLMYLLHNYMKSEVEYYDELQALLMIVKGFNPVYNNYFDGSLKDITNEMVSLRKEANGKLLKIVESMIAKHNHLREILSMANFDDLVISFSQWGEDIHHLYTSYTQYYKLDPSQGKTEIKIRRRPLIRVRYLNTFYKNLKSILISMGERSCSSTVIPSFEITIHRLSKCLDQFRSLDEAEKCKCDTMVTISSARDIVSLKKICAIVEQSQFENSDSDKYRADLHYFNMMQHVSQTYMKATLVFLPNGQLAIIEKENYCQMLLFAPLREKEFQFIKEDDADGNISLLFNHTIFGSKVQLCFTINKDEIKLPKILTRLFPANRFEIRHARDDIGGLGIISPLAAKTSISPSSSSTSSSADGLKSVRMSTPETETETETSLSTHESQCDDNEFTFAKPAKPSTPLYKQHLESGTRIGEQSTSLYHNYQNNQHVQKSSVPEAPLNKFDTSRERELSLKFLKQVVDDISSDEELDNVSVSGENSDDEMVSFTNISFAPIEQLPTPLGDTSSRKSSTVNNEKETEMAEPSKLRRVKKIDFKKYENSIINDASEPKLRKKKSFFSTFTKILSSKREVKKGEDVNNNSVAVSKEPTTRSNESLAKLAEIMNKDLTSTFISRVKICLWNTHTWTNTKDCTMMLHNESSSNEYLLGFYSSDDKSFSSRTISSVGSDYMKLPVLLMKLNTISSCTSNSIDIQMVAENHVGNVLTVLIRPFDGSDLGLINNTLLTPNETKLYLQRNESEVSIPSIYDDGNVSIPKVESMSSMESDDDNHVEKVGATSVVENKIWSGVGQLLEVLTSREIKDLNSCVMTFENRKDKGVLAVDMTGFEFGNIELELQVSDVQEVSPTEVSLGENYILQLESMQDMEMLYECIY